MMIVDIFIGEGDGEESLGEEVLLLMVDVSWVAGIADDLIDSLGELDFLVDLLEEDDSRVGGKPSSVEVDVDFFDFCRSGCLVGGFHGTLC